MQSAAKGGWLADRPRSWRRVEHPQGQTGEAQSRQRQASRDRLQAAGDFPVNVKAEILFEHLTTEVEVIESRLAPASDTVSAPGPARGR